MAIGVTRAVLRFTPGAVNRSGERGVSGFRSSLTQQCKQGDPDCGEHQAHSMAYGRNGEKSLHDRLPARFRSRLHQLEKDHCDRPLPPYSIGRIPIPRSPTRTISPAALPIRARAIGLARRNPPGMPVDYTLRSQLRVSMLSRLRRRRISARIVRPRPPPTLPAWRSFGSAVQDVFDRFGRRERELP